MEINIAEVSINILYICQLYVCVCACVYARALKRNLYIFLLKSNIIIYEILLLDPGPANQPGKKDECSGRSPSQNISQFRLSDLFEVHSTILCQILFS